MMTVLERNFSFVGPEQRSRRVERRLEITLQLLKKRWKKLTFLKISDGCVSSMVIVMADDIS